MALRERSLSLAACRYVTNEPLSFKPAPMGETPKHQIGRGIRSGRQAVEVVPKHYGIHEGLKHLHDPATRLVDRGRLFKLAGPSTLQDDGRQGALDSLDVGLRARPPFRASTRCDVVKSSIVEKQPCSAFAPGFCWCSLGSGASLASGFSRLALSPQR